MSDQGELGRPRYRPQPVQAPPGGVPGQRGSGQGPEEPDRTDPGATYALTLAILSWVVLPIIGAILAIRAANRALQRIDAAEAHGDVIGGLGVVVAAKWIAWGELALEGGAILFFVGPVVLGVFAGLFG